jgi:DNA mismatch endonuclease (patch repair protein)
MQHNVGRTTGIEARLQAALEAGGARFDVDGKLEPDVRWKADIVFGAERLCVFVDGCFWHGCPLHFKPPRTNTAWWTEKIQANIDRDKRQNETLTGRGWNVIRFWEHELSSDFDACVQKVIGCVKQKRRSSAADDRVAANAKSKRSKTLRSRRGRTASE